MKFSINDFLKFSIVDLVTFTEEIFNEKLHFCAVVVARIEPLVDDFLTSRFDISFFGILVSHIWKIFAYFSYIYMITESSINWMRFDMVLGLNY